MMYTWLCYMFFFPCGNGAESNPMEMECPFLGGPIPDVSPDRGSGLDTWMILGK